MIAPRAIRHLALLTISAVFFWSPIARSADPAQKASSPQAEICLEKDSSGQKIERTLIAPLAEIKKRLSPRTPAAEKPQTENSPFCTYGDQQSAPPPAYLFSWGSAVSLDRLGKNQPKNGPLPLNKIGQRYRITEMGGMFVTPEVAQEYPDLLGRSTLYAWSHPTAAMALNTEQDGISGETYAKALAGRPPALIAMKIDPKAKTMVIITKDGTSKPTKFDGVDLVLHYSLRDSTVQFREWLILNPKAVLEFTASPQGLPAQIKAEMLSSIEPTAALKPCEAFVIKNAPDATDAEKVERAQSAAFRGPLVKQFLNSHDSVPEVFQGSIK